MLSFHSYFMLEPFATSTYPPSVMILFWRLCAVANVMGWLHTLFVMSASQWVMMAQFVCTI